MTPILRSVIASLSLTAVVVTAAHGQNLEVDHVFIMVSAGSPASEQLRAVGFAVRPDSAVHEGIGTAAFGVAFSNAYLELVWVVDSMDFGRAPSVLPTESQWVLGAHRLASDCEERSASRSKHCLSKRVRTRPTGCCPMHPPRSQHRPEICENRRFSLWLHR